MYMSTDWADIGYHFLLDSNGYVYEARNPRAFPAAVYGYVRGSYRCACTSCVVFVLSITAATC